MSTLYWLQAFTQFDHDLLPFLITLIGHELLPLVKTISNFLSPILPE